MYGLPLSTDLSFFCDTTLLQVCVGEFQTLLNFTRSISVTIESKIRIDNTDATPPDLCCFLGSVVRSASADEAGSLNLTFHAGRVVSITDSNQDFESFQISAGDVEIIV